LPLLLTLYLWSTCRMRTLCIILGHITHTTGMQRHWSTAGGSCGGEMHSKSRLRTHCTDKLIFGFCLITAIDRHRPRCHNETPNFVGNSWQVNNCAGWRGFCVAGECAHRALFSQAQNSWRLFLTHTPSKKKNQTNFSGW